MLNRNKVIFILLACILAVGWVLPAYAAEDISASRNELRQQARDAQRRAVPQVNTAAASRGNGEAKLAPGAVPIGALPAPALAPCGSFTNQFTGIGCDEYYIWQLPQASGTGQRRKTSTRVINSGVLPESVMTVHVLVLWDPLDELGIGVATAGTPDLTVTLSSDLGGLPDDAGTLTTVTRTFADWTTDPDLGTFGGSTLVGYLDFDVSGAGVVLAPGTYVHATFAPVQATPNVDWLWAWTDSGNDDASGCDNGDKSAMRRNDIAWVSMGTFFGFNYNWSIYYDLCTEQPPPVCFTQHNWCDAAASVTIFGMPRTNRYAFANRYFGGQVGTPQPCTVKTLYPWFYENNPADSADIEIKIYADDGFGLPGAVLWQDTLAYASLVKDLSGPTTVPVPDVVVTGDYYVGYSAINSSVAINGITFVGSLLPEGSDANCPVYNPDAMWVQTLPALTWVDDLAFFGSNSELWVDVDICCPELPFATCFPTSDLDWSTRSNNFQRTNVSSAMLDLCGITQAWTANVDPAPGVNPVLNVNFTSPVIAGGKVLVSDFNTLRCYDQALGTLLWSFGGFPYVGDDLRCNVTVEGDSAVYVGGASFRAFSKIRLSDGSVIWSRNAGGVDVPLGSGFTRFAPSVLDGGAVITIDEAGAVWKLDPATGADLAAPITLPDAPGAIPLDALTGDGAGKVWVGTTNPGTLSDGNIHQIDIASWMIDWTLADPSFKFTGDAVRYEPEGFPGPLGYESGILYYHSRVRDDANAFDHFPNVGGVGAIDATTEDGTGIGVMWVAPSDVGGVLYSGVTVGPGMIYTGHQGVFISTSEPHGVAAYDKTLGLEVWNYAFGGAITEGENEGGTVVNNLRVALPITLVCGLDGVPYLFVGDDGGGGGTVASGGDWHLFNGNTGEELWRRKFSGRVSGTAVADGFLAVATNANANGTSGGGGSLIAFTVGGARPRLQIDSEQVFRTATPGDGLSPVNSLVDAISNTGCSDLNIAGYSVVDVAPTGPGPVRAIISDVNPVLAASARNAAQKTLTGGYDLMLASMTEKQKATMRADLRIYDPEAQEAEANVRTFAENVNKAAAVVFLTFNSGPALVPAGGTGTLDVQYDETGLSNNTLYINYILIDSDDPDFYPQDPAGALFGDPYVQFNLFIGCPDDDGYLTLGLGQEWVTNFGAKSDGAGNGFQVNGHTDADFDGGYAAVVTNNNNWALEGVSVGAGSRAKEWGPTLPCGINIGAGSYANPIGGFDAVDTVSYNMIDLASSQGYFPVGDRQLGGVLLNIQNVGSHDPVYGDFGVVRVTITNEVDGNGALTDFYFGQGRDWDVAPFGDNNGTNYPDGNYAIDNGGPGGRGASSLAYGTARLDAPAIGAAILRSGGTSQSFMMGDFSDNGDVGGFHGFDIMSDPLNYACTFYPGECATIADDDLGAFHSMIHIPSLAEGASETLYYGTFGIEDGVNGRTWTNAAEFDAAVGEIICRAKAFAGFGKGDLNCDGCNDLADVVLLGNIVDGVNAPSPAAVYTADVDGDNDIDNDDYDLLYNVVSGVGGVLANAWRF